MNQHFLDSLLVNVMKREVTAVPASRGNLVFKHLGMELPAMHLSDSSLGGCTSLGLEGTWYPIESQWCFSDSNSQSSIFEIFWHHDIIYIYIHYLITQNTTSSLFYKTEIVCVCPPNMYQNVKQNYKLCIYTLEKTHCKNSKISFGFCGDSEKRYPHLFPPTVGFVSATPLRPPIFRCSVLRRDASSPALLGGSSVW